MVPVLGVERRQGRHAETHDPPQQVQAVHHGEALGPQQPHRDERLSRSPGMADEQPERDQRCRLGNEKDRVVDGRVPVADAGDPEVRGQDEQPHQHQSADIRPGPRRSRGVGDELDERAEQHDPDRDVDEEDPSPRQVAHQQPADDRAEDLAARGDRAEHADRPVAISAVVLGDDSGRRGLQRAATDGLDRPEADQQVNVGRHAAQQGRDGEQDHRAEEDPPPPELIAYLPGDRQHDDHAEAVDGNGPARPVDGGTQAVMDRGAGRWRRSWRRSSS